MGHYHAAVNPTTLVFGGSFDPPHAAHVLQPKSVADAIGADRVLYIPAAKAPHKLGQTQTPAPHRLAMLRLALEYEPWAEISTLELDRAQANPGVPSYTVDTLIALKAQFPERKLRLLIGSDQLMIFHQWKDWQTVVKLAEPAVMVRAPHATAHDVLAQLPTELNAAEWAPRLVDPMDVPVMNMSSTEIRRQISKGIKNGKSIPWVGSGVAAYIQEHGLYR